MASSYYVLRDHGEAGIAAFCGFRHSEPSHPWFFSQQNLIPLFAPQDSWYKDFLGLKCQHVGMCAKGAANVTIRGVKLDASKRVFKVC